MAPENAITRAVGSPLVRGGLTIGAGIVTGNVIGFVRVALMAYLLGTGSMADSLVVAIGPIDALNGVLINSMVFAFVPMLTQREGSARHALFAKLFRSFTTLYGLVTASILVLAPWLMRLLAPGLAAPFFDAAVWNLRILSISTLASGITSIYCALLYTDRRFAPSAFNQACLNIGTVGGALLLWRLLGVHAFALGYTAGALAQLLVVWWASRPGVRGEVGAECPVSWRDLLTKPVSIALFTGGLALNIAFTRAFATHAGPGVAAALDYCMRGVAVPVAFLVSPMSTSLLPEIARLRSQGRLSDAFRLIDRTIALASVVAVSGIGFAILLREPAIRLLFERGSFTAHSTAVVSAVFLGLGPSVIGWSLMELTSRSLFALDRSWLPATAAFVPLLINMAVTVSFGNSRPELIGLGPSLGLMAGFALVFGLAHAHRGKWLAAATASANG